MAKQTSYPSLDQQGTQAAVYPSEDALWTVGPTITDADDGIVYPSMPPQADSRTEEAYLHETINGETTNEAYDEEWVNVQQYGPTGFGNWNDDMQVFQTGHSQIVVSNPAAEQGWGVGPARRWAHYPHEESKNP